MGLRNKAFHVMLANGRVAPFYIRGPPVYDMNWTIVDHLITIYKIKESDYVEDQPLCSVTNMAARLRDIYADECTRTRYLVLVRDGHGSKKPAVCKQRESQPVPRHIVFYKQHAALIEYAVLHMLYDIGFGDCVFFVTGADMSAYDNATASLSLHQTCSEATRKVADNIAVALDVGVRDEEASYYNKKPTGAHGVFMYTCADPHARGYLELLRACLQCRGVEADTVMIELAANLKDTKMVCTRDTDTIAILTAIGDTDTVLRLDNLSYKRDKNMFLTPFYYCLVGSAQPAREPDLSNLETSAARLYTLCDVEADIVELPRDVRDLHESWEMIVTATTGITAERVARSLCRAGIRGALYVDLLRLTFGLPALTDTLAFATRIGTLIQVRDDESKARENSLFNEIFAACPADAVVAAILDVSCEHRQRRRNAAMLEIDPKHAPCESENEFLSPPNSKRPRTQADERADYTKGYDQSCSDGQAAEIASEESRDPPCSKITYKDLLSRYRTLRKMYESNSLREGTYGRYLALCNAGPYVYLSKKSSLLIDSKKRNIKLIFMILSGTDYTFTLPGLGGTKILTKTIAHRGFGPWCLELVEMWANGRAQSTAIHDHAIKLAQIAGLSARKINNAWTPEMTNKCINSMEYAYKLWTLQNPTYGPRYYSD